MRKERQADNQESVLLMGFYGKRNFGDDLLCLSLGRYLLDHSNCKIILCTSDEKPFGQLIKASDRVSIIPRRATSILVALSRCTVLCQGGGTIFHDSYSGWRRWKYQVNLMAWGLLFFLSRLLGVKVIVAGAGIGPFRFGISRAFTRFALSFCSAVSVRDGESRSVAIELVRNIPILLGGDLAELWKCADGRGKRLGRSSDESVLDVGISILDLSPFFPGSNPNDYWSKFAEVLRGLSERQFVRVHILSLYEEPGVGDSEVSRTLVRELGPRIWSKIYSYESDIDAMLQRVSLCDIIIATRYHAAIAAYVMQRPFGVICYNKKVCDFARDVRLPSSAIFQITPPPESSEILGFFDVSNATRGPVVSAESLANRRLETVKALIGVFQSVGLRLS